MKVTIRITDERPKLSSQFRTTSETETHTVVECEDVEFTSGLTASFLRAIANEINPQETR